MMGGGTENMTSTLPVHCTETHTHTQIKSRKYGYTRKSFVINNTKTKYTTHSVGLKGWFWILETSSCECIAIIEMQEIFNIILSTDI